MSQPVTLHPEEMYSIACYAVRTDYWSSSIAWEERVDAAYCAIAEQVWSGAGLPERSEMIRIAREASNGVIEQDMRHHGIDKRGATFGEQRVNFLRYWFHLPGDPLADRVVDRVGLAQIWWALTDVDQEALVALATWRDYGRAASELGLKYQTFCRRVGRARQRFFALWHEGEAPSSLWGRDRLHGRNRGRTAVRVHSRHSRSGVTSGPVSNGGGSCG